MNQTITPGFYYHYKHKEEEGVEHYAYEVVGFGLHTEIDNESDAKIAIYRPLYESANVYEMGKMYYLRPYSMFADEVTKDGVTRLRFERITNPELISHLESVRNRMYQ
ncbi:MAG TPA: DUF1653 domain-containing protein [Candidatus Paceibacterota bacterium]